MKYANYQYSLSRAQQQAIQLWLRLRIPPQVRGDAWELLHSLTYTNSWSDEPQFDVPGTEEETEQ